MNDWRTIESLPAEDQPRARAAVERRAGPFPHRQPAWTPCPHPVELHVTVGDPATTGVTWCNLCSDDADDRARAVLAWLRDRSSTVRLLASQLALELADARRLVERLVEGGLVVRVGYIGEETDGGLQAVGVWRSA